MQKSHFFNLSPGSGLPLCLLLSGTDKEQRAQERQETAHRNPTVKHSLTNPLQYSCLKNPRVCGAWWAAVYRVAESDTTEVTQQQMGSGSSLLGASSQLWHEGSKFPDQGSNPNLLGWELRVLTSRPPRKSQPLFLQSAFCQENMRIWECGWCPFQDKQSFSGEVGIRQKQIHILGA